MITALYDTNTIRCDTMRYESATVRLMLGCTQFSAGDLDSPTHTIEKIYYHPI